MYVPQAYVVSRHGIMSVSDHKRKVLEDEGSNADVDSKMASEYKQSIRQTVVSIRMRRTWPHL